MSSPKLDMSLGHRMEQEKHCYNNQQSCMSCLNQLYNYSAPGTCQMYAIIIYHDYFINAFVNTHVFLDAVVAFEIKNLKIHQNAA